MARQRAILAICVALTVLTLTPALHADTKIIVSHRITGHRPGITTWIGRPPAPMVCHKPPHRRVVVTAPWRRRFIRMGPPCVRRVEPVVIHRPVVEVVRPPVQRHVVIQHPPTVTVKAPAPVAAGSVTVWVTNSNGSRTSVSLRRHGPWYIGPRGEYYKEMPTNDQLRMVYGF